MVCDTLSSQDASTHQIWNSYLKEYRRYGPDTKVGRTDGQCDYYTPPKFLWGHKKFLYVTRKIEPRRFVEWCYFEVDESLTLIIIPDALAVCRPTGVYLLDFFCSGIQFNLLLSPYPCFISLLYLDLYVLGDDALIS